MTDNRSRSPSGRGRRLPMGVGLLAATLLAVAVPPVRADLPPLEIEVLNSTASAPGTGSFDVVLTNPSSTPSAAVAGFSVELTIASPYINFTAVNTPSNYLFTSTGSLFGGLQLDVLSASELLAYDVALSGGVALNPGDIYGLMNVTYSVGAGAATGPYSVTIADVGVSTSLSDTIGNSLAFGTANGTIQIQGTVTTPEPSSLTVAALAGVFSLLEYCCRRKRLI